MAQIRSNLKSFQIELPALSDWVELTHIGTITGSLHLYTKSVDALVCIGHDVPIDDIAFLLPVQSALDLVPVPSGRIFLRNLTNEESATVYGIGG